MIKHYVLRIHRKDGQKEADWISEINRTHRKLKREYGGKVKCENGEENGEGWAKFIFPIEVVEKE